MSNNLNTELYITCWNVSGLANNSELETWGRRVPPRGDMEGSVWTPKGEPAKGFGFCF